MKLRTYALFAAIFAAVLAAFAIFGTTIDAADAPSSRGRIVILMVWDGLRPDAVTPRDTPTLYEMSHQGVRFDHHHSMYPTLTMVNAAALATGATPGVDGIVANTMYLAPMLEAKAVTSATNPLAQKLAKPVMLESTPLLASLSGPGAFAGHLLDLDTVAQQVEREGGYLAVGGKEGPTFLFDNRVESVKDGADSNGNLHKDYLFATDDLMLPAQADAEKVPAASPEGAADSERDAYFTRIVSERAIPAAKLASDAGHPALIVLWQHNPDLTQHLAGLGTLPALEALSAVDLNLAKVRAGIVSANVSDRTDVIVVSDHGFATVRMTVDMNALLTTAGLKKALDSDDVIVARNGGSDLIYLSKTAFPSESAQRDELQKIVNFAEAQEWCGPIFSRELAEAPIEGKRHRKRPVDKPFLGWIDGTFAEQVVGILNPSRSPDLVISFREISDQDNDQLTGPEKLAFELAAKGQTPVKNKSKTLVHPVKGIMYADAPSFTTGMGMHGAAGQMELHNFGAAFGPDFKRSFIDTNPTANVDVAPTITHILHLAPNVGPGGAHATGRVMTEAFPGERPWVGTAKPISLSTKLTLQGVEVTNTLRITRMGDHDYLDNATEARNPLGSSP
jgi:hypothetical protein